MTTQVSNVAKNVRIHEWALQIQDCKSRPSNMSVEEWCERNQITKANYYYRLRRVRETLIMNDQVPKQFVELPVPVEPAENHLSVHGTNSSDIAATITVRGDIKIDIRNQVSSSFLAELLKAVTAC